jgi:hypothetical protein
MAVSFPEGEIAEATTSGERSWAADAITVKEPSDRLDCMKNVLLVVRLEFRVWSCEDDTTWTTIVWCDTRSVCYDDQKDDRCNAPLSERNRAEAYVGMPDSSVYQFFVFLVEGAMEECNQRAWSCGWPRVRTLLEGECGAEAQSRDRVCHPTWRKI